MQALGILSAISFFLGVAVWWFAITQTGAAIHEVEAFILLLISAVCGSAAFVIAELQEHRKPSGEGSPEPDVPAGEAT